MYLFIYILYQPDAFKRSLFIFILFKEGLRGALVWPYNNIFYVQNHMLNVCDCICILEAGDYIR